jgi:hypothetical protein
MPVTMTGPCAGEPRPLMFRFHESHRIQTSGITNRAATPTARQLFGVGRVAVRSVEILRESTAAGLEPRPTSGSLVYFAERLYF